MQSSDQHQDEFNDLQCSSDIQYDLLCNWYLVAKIFQFFRKFFGYLECFDNIFKFDNMYIYKHVYYLIDRECFYNISMICNI